jgi:cytochrome c553
MFGLDAARRMRAIRRVFLFCCVIACGSVLAQSKTDPARGQAKAAVCGACHGTPKTPPLERMPSLAGQQREFLVLQMFIIREGLRDVPEMKGMLNGFSDPDLEDVAAYFAAQPPAVLGGKPDPKRQARGAELSKTMGCGSCHMSKYEGQRQVPRLTNQREDYVAASLKAYRDNRRTGIDTVMNATMYKVPDADIEALAHYLAHR